MCGILAVIGKRDPQEVKSISKRMSHRGPDESDFHVCPKTGSMLTHERLSIIDLTTGKQPIRGTREAYVVHNGEIYNHQQLRDGILSHHRFRTHCDSEVIVHLYEEYGYDFLHLLDGVFGFVVLDGERFIAGRDPIGVKPLYYGRDAQGRLYFSSELKAIADQCVELEAFPPGHYYTPETGFVRYYKPEWFAPEVATREADLDLLREKLTESVRKRLMSDVPLGVLLSGGLDSSLVASIAKRLLGPSQELHSFSVGIGGQSPDLLAARAVAASIGTLHHEVEFSVEQGIAALKDLVWHLESYDVTTIRASTPMYFLSKAIVERGIKVVLSGEGADEIFGGYLYFHNAPSPAEFQAETVRRVRRLSTADCLRADKSTMAHGLEARVPFLDKDFLDAAMRIRPEDKQPDRASGKPEKYILRKAFEDALQPYLPEQVLWRQKEQFSDGVGYSWIDTLVAYCQEQVSDLEMANAATRFPHNTPATKEAYFYRSLFEEFYPGQQCAQTVKRWVPKWQQNIDPSGRAAEAHVQHEAALFKASPEKISV